MNALLVVFAKVPEKHLEITIAADARRQYIPSFAQRRSTLSKATSKNLSKMMNKKAIELQTNRRKHLVKGLCFLSSMCVGAVSKCT